MGLNIDPFVVAVYCGSSKPADLADYLKEFVNECTDLLLHGIVIDGSTFQIKVHSFVCDAPARSFLKGIKSHNAYSGCERCHVVGQYVNNRMLFLDIDAQPRTDDSFKSMVDEEHHLQLSPLAQLPIGMVSQFVLDPMHLLYLGVMRRLLYCWLKGPLPCALVVDAVQKSQRDLLALGNTYLANLPEEPVRLLNWIDGKPQNFVCFCCIVESLY